MRVVFRVDAALHIGSGHAIRCLTLAGCLKQQGAECIFICRSFSGNLCDLIKQKGHEVYVLPVCFEEAHLNQELHLPYQDWLGVSQHEDAHQTILVFKKINQSIDWLIVDHYGIDYLWQNQLRAYTQKIMVIDDLANRRHNADLLLDQNLYLNYQIRYQNLVSKSCRVLLGPKYALLRPEFAHYRSEPKSKNEYPKILVFFGGIDLEGETLKFLQTIQNKFTQYKFEVVLGRQSPHFQAALRLSEKQEHITLWYGCDEMAKLMHQCDFAFGASGSTNWERFCLGLNTALVCVADNQRQLLDDLAAQNLVICLGDSKQVTSNTYQDILINLDELKTNLGMRIREYCDGLGVNRIVDYLKDGYD